MGIAANLAADVADGSRFGRCGVSALVRFPPTSDIDWRGRYGRKVPGAAVSRCSNVGAELFDHLVGAGKQRRWDFNADRPRGLQIDHQLVLGWRLHRQIGRLLTLKNAIHVASCVPERVNRIRPIGEQATGGTM